MLQALLNIMPHRRAALTARLVGVSGFTGRGDIRFAARKNEKNILFVDLRGLAGCTAMIFVNGTQVATIEISKGRAGKSLSSRAGHKFPKGLSPVLRGMKFPKIGPGDNIDVRQNGDVILSGVFEHGSSQIA